MINIMNKALLDFAKVESPYYEIKSYSEDFKNIREYRNGSYILKITQDLRNFGMKSDYTLTLLDVEIYHIGKDDKFNPGPLYEINLDKCTTLSIKSLNGDINRISLLSILSSLAHYMKLYMVY